MFDFVIPFLAVFAGAALTIVLIFYLLRRRQDRTQEDKVTVQRPPANGRTNVRYIDSVYDGNREMRHQQDANYTTIAKKLEGKKDASA